MSTRSLRRLAVLGTALALMLTIGAATAAAQSPGDPTITVGVGDDVAGGETTLTFDLHFSGTDGERHARLHLRARGRGRQRRPDRRRRAPIRRSTPTRPTSSRPATTRPLGGRLPDQRRADHRPRRASSSAPPATPASSRSTRSTTARSASPTRPTRTATRSSCSPTTSVDDAYYDCDATQYTVGYFAPEFIEQDGMNVIVIDTEDWDELVGNPDTTDLTIEGVIAPRAPAPAAQLLRPGRALLGRRGPRGLRDLPQRLPAAARTRHLPPGLPPRDLADPLGRRSRELRRLVLLLPVPLGAGGRQRRRRRCRPDQQYDGAGGDLLIKLIFENAADGMEGVQAAIDAVQRRAPGGGPALGARICSRTGRSPSTSTTRTRAAFDIKRSTSATRPRRRGRSRSRTTSTGAAATCSRAPCRRPSGAIARSAA